VCAETVDPENRSKSEPEEAFDGADIVFGAAHEKRVAASFGQTARQLGSTPAKRVMEERGRDAVVVSECGESAQHVLRLNAMAAGTR
jgi:hypothetical protein